MSRREDRNELVLKTTVCKFAWNREGSYLCVKNGSRSLPRISDWMPVANDDNRDDDRGPFRESRRKSQKVADSFYMVWNACLFYEVYLRWTL